jgi:serine/threonine protein kinase
MPLTAGATLGPYEILARAGAGGMGEVYKARDTRLNRTVAIKVLPAALTADPDARQRLDREAKAVAALSHPHICSLFDIGHQDGTDFLVMEFLEGETLAERLTRGKLPLDEALRTGIQIADALGTAHKAGIIHRDLKPGNVMLTTRGATLLDFGLAKPPPVALSAAVTQVATQQPFTSAGTLVGTLQYMAPEQLQGLSADARTDVFAFGCVLYEMVTGRRAFTGDSPASVIAAILEREPAPMAGGSEPIPVPVLDAIVRTCLAKNPDDRWWSAHDVGVALARLGRVAEPPTHPRASRWPARWSALGWGIAALFFATTIAAVYRSNGRPEDGSTMSAVKSVIDFPNLVLGFPNLSPDGRYVSMFAFSGDQEGRRVVVRRLDDGAVTWLAGTERAQPATWSPDSGRWASHRRLSTRRWNHQSVRALVPARRTNVPLRPGQQQRPATGRVPRITGLSDGHPAIARTNERCDLAARLSFVWPARDRVLPAFRYRPQAPRGRFGQPRFGRRVLRTVHRLCGCG